MYYPSIMADSLLFLNFFGKIGKFMVWKVSRKWLSDRKLAVDPKIQGRVRYKKITKEGE